MSFAKFAACDLGAESGRVILGQLDGGRLELREIHRFPNRLTRAAGHFHWDVLALFSELKTGLARLASEGHRDLKGIGVDTWGVDFGLLDRRGGLLGFPYAYRDSYTDGMMEAAFERIPREELYGITGLQFLQFNTVYQLLSIARSGSRVLDIADRLLFMPDLFHYLLTGVKTTEYTIASTSQLLDAWRRSWSERILTALELPVGLTGPIVPPGTLVGPLLGEVGNETGLGSVPVIAPACHDTASAVAAVPGVGNDWAYLSSGTWSLLGIESPEPMVSADSLAANLTNEGGFGGRMRILRNNMGLWLLERCRAAWKSQGIDYSYDDLVRLAEGAETSQALIDPDHPGFLNPPDMPEAIAAFCRETGQPVPSTHAAFARIIFESLALKYRYIVEKIQALKGRKIETLYVVGGGSKNRLLNQLTADVLGVPVVAGPGEATAAGNILIQAVSAGELGNLEEIRGVVRESFRLHCYEPTEADVWEDRYQAVRPLLR